MIVILLYLILGSPSFVRFGIAALDIYYQEMGFLPAPNDHNLECQVYLIT